MYRLSAGIICLTLLAGCAQDAEDEGLAASHEAMFSQNLLSANLLSSNLLSLNLLSSNLLSSNLLSSNRLALNMAATNGIETTVEGRELLRYLARCALGPSTTIEFTTGGTTYVFPGLFGLAPEWQGSTLTLAQKRFVSACLMSHTNAFGISVPISARSMNKISTSTQETQTFTTYEATFYGNLFDGELLAYACVGENVDSALQKSAYREYRACADAVPGSSTSACGFVVTGNCNTVCNMSGAGTRSCRPPGSWTDYREAISVFLITD